MVQSRRFVKITLIILFLVAVMGGFIIYSLSFSTGEGFTNIFLASLQGIFHTIRLFIFETSELELYTDNILIHILFWISHLAAVVFVQATLFTIFGRNIIDNLKFRYGWHKDIFFIKGSDRYALMLAENIATNDKPGSTPLSERLIVLLIDEEDDSLEKARSLCGQFGAMVKVTDREQDILHYLTKAGFGKNNKKYHFVLPPNNPAIVDDTFILANRSAEVKSINSDSLHIYVFTDNVWDRTKIVNITQTDNGEKYPCTFHLISENDLILRGMIIEHHPGTCSALNFNEMATAERSFKVMILGFGEIGKSAFERLVLNGQFLTKDDTIMQAIIVDKEINQHKESFRLNYPAIEVSCDVQFYELDTRCKDFYELFKTHNQIDYIVIALSSNDLNKQMANDIRLYFMQSKQELPFIAVSEKNESQHYYQPDEKIFTFGCKDHIYTYAQTICESANSVAKAIHELYGGLIPWHKLAWFYQESSRASADFIPAMKKMADLCNGDSEILSKVEHLRWNAFHIIMGYRPITIKEMKQRFKDYKGEKYTQKHMDYCRRDNNAKLHACLTSWDNLNLLSTAYRQVALEAVGCLKQILITKGYTQTELDIICKSPKTVPENQELAQLWWLAIETNRCFKENDTTIIRNLDYFIINDLTEFVKYLI